MGGGKPSTSHYQFLPNDQRVRPKFPFRLEVDLLDKSSSHWCRRYCHNSILEGRATERKYAEQNPQFRLGGIDALYCFVGLFSDSYNVGYISSKHICGIIHL